MFMFCFIFIIYVFTSASHIISEEEYKLLPPVYGMDDHKECVRKKDIYCEAVILLNPFNRNSSVWRLMEETRKDKYMYNHDIIHRTICVPEVYQNKLEEIKRFTAGVVNKEIGKFNLTPTIDTINCKKQSDTSATDYILWISVFSYVLLIGIATLCDLIIRRKNGVINGNNILITFSLRSNIEKIFQQNRSKDYQKLKCIQGVRTFSSILVISVHTEMSFTSFFVGNTKYIEDLHQHNSFLIYTTFNLFIVQTFLLISSWLLTIQVFDIFEANKKFTIKDAILLFISRCFRLWPAVVLAIPFQQTLLIQKILDFTVVDTLDSISNACRNYWWTPLLFVQNNFKVKYMCNGIVWYVSTDVQLYAMALVILYLILKFNSTKKILGFCLLMSYAVFGFVIYSNDLDIVFRPSPEHYKWQSFRNDTNFKYLYTMTHVSSTTCILGMCFGIFYYNLQNKHVVNKKIFLAFLQLAFFVLPFLAVVLASREYSGISAALVGPLLKPLFSLGIGMGILGMSQSTGGIMKKIFEWRPLEFLSQFTYCVYIYHFFVVFYRIVTTQKPLDVSIGIITIGAINDVFFGFVLGFIMYMCVELPWSNIQKMCLPQIKKRVIKKE